MKKKELLKAVAPVAPVVATKTVVPHVPTEREKAALVRGVESKSTYNFRTVVAHFAKQGIELPKTPEEIRECVKTYDAWRALGRVVNTKNKGKGCRIVVIGLKNGKKAPFFPTVWHISQTVPYGTEKPAPAPAPAPVVKAASAPAPAPAPAAPDNAALFMMFQQFMEYMKNKK